MLPRNLFVHVVCGAGTGTTLMRIMADEGNNVTAGVLKVVLTSVLFGFGNLRKRIKDKDVYSKR